MNFPENQYLFHPLWLGVLEVKIAKVREIA